MAYEDNTFPAAIENPASPVGTDKVATIDHAGLEDFQNDSVKTLKDKVGVDGSAVTTSHDYKLGEVTGSDKAVSKTATQTLTNKTLTAPTMTSPDFSTIENTGTVTLPTGTETLVGRATTDTLTNKTLTSPTLTTPVFNTSISGTAFLDEDDLSSDSANKVASQQSIKAYVDNSVVSGKPEIWSSHNILVATQGINYTDEFFRIGNFGTGQFTMTTTNADGLMTSLDTNTSTWTDADLANGGWVVSNNFIYGMLEDIGTSPDTFRVYRYPISSITDAGTLMTFAGATVLAQSDETLGMTSDGTNFYFSYEAGNSSNEYVIAKYTLSGTTLTYSSSITLSDSADFSGFAINGTTGDIYTLNSNVMKRYNASGVLQETSAAFAGQGTLLNFQQTLYSGDVAAKTYSILI